MRMYHWHGVRAQWAEGDIVVFASSLEQARQIAFDALGEDDSEPNVDQATVMTETPQILESPSFLIFHGSA